MISLVKSSLRLLFRAKVFWFFLLIVPLLSSLMINMKASMALAGNTETLVELEDAGEKVAYYGGHGEFIVKVYDASDDELSNFVLDKLSETGMMIVCVADVKDNVQNDGISEDFVQDRIDYDGREDRMGAALFIEPGFEDRMLSGKEDEAVRLFSLSDDARLDILKRELDLQLSKIKGCKDILLAYSGNDVSAKDVLSMMENVDEKIPGKEVISIDAGTKTVLTQKQTDQKTKMGYAFSFLTFAFIFCGIFVAHNTITEQKNGVLVRVDLAGISPMTYFASKFVCAFITSIMVTVMVTIYTFILGLDNIGMERWQFIILVFLMGSIFSTISVLLGILMGDVLSSCIAAFTIWCMSSMLSGLYFPLDFETVALKVLAGLMPQKWFMNAIDSIFVKDNSVYSMIICVTVAYILAMISIGALGLKMKRTEEWGSN